MGSVISMIIVFGILLYPAIQTTLADKRRAAYLEELIRKEMLQGKNDLAQLHSDQLATIKRRTKC